MYNNYTPESNISPNLLSRNRQTLMLDQNHFNIYYVYGKNELF
jgi:hypothetical protein